MKLKEILKEKSMLVKVANQTELERDNAKSRYEKVLLVAPYSSETNSGVVEDNGDKWRFSTTTKTTRGNARNRATVHFERASKN